MSAITRALAGLILRITGWSLVGERPSERSYVLIAAPHTSNWDLFYLLTFAFRYRVKMHWMGKHTIFRPPFGGLMKRLGGVPIYRHKRENLVEQMAKRLAAGEPLVLVVPAEGTRAQGEYWKSGFYHIANLARVPIRLGFLDYAHKKGSFGPELMPTGDIPSDMDRIREFYREIRGKYPAKQSPVRLREEEAR